MSKRADIADKVVEATKGFPSPIEKGKAIAVLYALEQLGYQVVPTDETIEYYGFSKGEAQELSLK
jgi:hypothetical protein